MTEDIRIFSYLPNPRVWKSLITAKLAKVEIKVIGDKPRNLPEWLWDFDAKKLEEIDTEELEKYKRQSKRGFKGDLFKTDEFLDNEVIDSLKLARKISPGKKNTLDALCERYSIDNSDRTLHGALLDAKLLAFVYLKMTIGQNKFSDLTSEKNVNDYTKTVIDDNFKIIEPSDEDKKLHINYFNKS